MRATISLLALLVALGVSGKPASHLPEEDKEEELAWQGFKARFGKGYAEDAAEATARSNYLIHRERLEELRHRVSFGVGEMEWMDLSSAQVEAKFGRCLLPSPPVRAGNEQPFEASANAEIPASLDWRKLGYVNEPGDQGQCGSCWAFSTTGVLEGQMKRKTGRLPKLSEQNLVDCSRDFGNDGCNGGWPMSAYVYVQYNGGIDTEASYPYKGADLRCHYNNGTSGGEDKGFIAVDKGNETELMLAVAELGPVSVAINCAEGFIEYNGTGIIKSDNCPGGKLFLDHAILVVGYGREDGQDYWLVKNSWGLDWGDGGYGKMARNYGNMCGIATEATVPIV